MSCSFVCATIVQYGVALNFAHLNAADDVVGVDVGTGIANQTVKLKDCIVSHVILFLKSKKDLKKIK